MKKTICVQMEDDELVFDINLDDYNRCVNSLQPDNKVNPMHNFLINTAANNKTKEAVNRAWNEALTADLFGVVIGEFKPKVDITVKKSRPEPSKLNVTA